MNYPAASCGELDPVAMKMFRAAVTTNVTEFVEHEAAKVEIKRLDS
jgi:lipoprotein NlpI